jgi:hypothetical protein
MGQQMTRDDMHDESETLKKARAYVDSLGFPIPQSPYDSGIAWPENVADLESQELAAHLTHWSAWAGYARYQLAVAETNHTAFSTEFGVNEQVCLYKSKGDYKTVTELKASVHQLPKMQELRAKVLKAEAEKKIIKALLDGYEMKYSTISREISRRTQDFRDAHE